MHTTSIPLQVEPCYYTRLNVILHWREHTCVKELLVNVTCQDTNHTLLLLAVKEDGKTFIGRNWLTNIQLDWKAFYSHWRMAIR